MFGLSPLCLVCSDFHRDIKTLEQVNRHFSLQYHLGNYMYSDSIVRKLHEDLLSVWMQKALEISDFH